MKGKDLNYKIVIGVVSIILAIVAVIAIIANTTNIFSNNFGREKVNALDSSISIETSITPKSITGSGFANLKDVKKTADGGYVAVGSFQGEADLDGDGVVDVTSKGGLDALIVKYNSKNEYQWYKTYGTQADEQYNGVDVTSDGYVVAGYEFTDKNQDGFLVKLDNQGNEVWKKSMNGDLDDEARDVAVTSSGNIVVVGRYRSASLPVTGRTGNMSNSGNYDGFVFCYGDDGTYKWGGPLAGANNVEVTGVTATGTSVVISANFIGTVTIGSTSVTSAGGQDAILVSYNETNGAYQWSQKIGGANLESIQDVTTDIEGNVVAVGAYSTNNLTLGTQKLTVSNANFSSSLIAKYNSTGTFLKAYGFGNTVATDNKLEAVTPTEEGGIVVTGWYNGTLTVGSDSYTATGTNISDAIVVRLDRNLDPIWSRDFSGTSYNAGFGVTTISKDKYVAVGNFDSSSLNSKGEKKILASKGYNDAYVVGINETIPNKDISYTVDYYQGNTKVTEDTQIVNNIVSALAADTLTVDKTQINIDDKYYGYKLGSIMVNNVAVSNVPTTVNSGDIIRINYIVDSAQQKNLSYTVNYYKGDTLMEGDTQTVNNRVQVLEPDTLTVNKSQINVTNKYLGYRVDNIKVNDTDSNKVPDTVPDKAVINIYYVIDESQTKELSYTIEYYFDGKKQGDGTVIKQSVQILQDDKLKYDTELSAYKRYTGYKLDSTLPATIPDEIDNGAVIKVYYITDPDQRKDLSYTVQYYKGGQPDETEEGRETFTTNVQVLQPDTLTVDQTKISLTGKYKGYKLDAEATGTIPTSVDNGAIIKVYYVIDDSQVKTLNYKVEYYKNDERVDADTQTASQVVQVLQPDTISVNRTEINIINKYDGCKLGSIKVNDEIVDRVPDIVNSGDVIKVCYVTDDDQTKNLSYTVEYYLAGNKKESDTQTVVQTVQKLEPDILTVNKDTVRNDDKYTGYKFEKTVPAVLQDTIRDGGVIEVYYTVDESQTKDLSYTVQYYKDGILADTDSTAKVTVQVLQPNTLPVDTSKINLIDKYYGYKLNAAETGTIPTTVTDGTIIKVYYVTDNSLTKELNYKVEYYQGDTKVESDTQTVTQTVQVLQPDTLAVNKGSINITNKYNGYKLGHLGKDDETITELPSRIESGSTIKVFYVIDDSKTKLLSYTVEYYRDNVKVNADTQTVSETVQILHPDTLEVRKDDINISNKYNGYKLDELRINNRIVAAIPDEVDNGNVIKVFYGKRTDLSYVVKYRDTETKESINDDTTVDRQTFGSVIKGEDQAIAINGYNFDYADPAQLEIGTGENIVTVYYSKVTGLSYTINYLDKVTGEVIYPADTQGGQTFGNEILASEQVIEISGYDYDSANIEKLSIGTDATKNVINMYYTKRTNLSYVVNFFDKATNERIHEPVTKNNVEFKSVITCSSERIDIAGYNYDSANKETMTVEIENNIINLYYTKRTDMAYTINFFDADTDEQIREPLTKTATFKSEIVCSDEKIDVDGYNYSSAETNKIVIGTENNVINLYYTKKTDLSYKVNYLEKGTINSIRAQKTVNNKQFGAIIVSESEKVEIDGYNYDSAEKAEVIIGTGENIINLYYTKRTDLSYTINYLEKNTNKVLHEPVVMENKTFGEQITSSYDALRINGYNYDSASQDTLTITTSENTINLYYTKRNDLTYTVNYLEKDTNVLLSTAKVAENVVFETVVTAEDEAKTIAGYKYDSASAEKLTVGTGENIITLYYVKRTDLNYRVNYLDKESGDSLREQKIVGNKTLGEKVSVINEIIEIDGYNQDSVDKTSLTIGAGENIINIYYTKRTDLSYTINYLEKDTNKVLAEPTVVRNVAFETMISTANKAITINGYEYNSVNKSNLIVGTNATENVINIYYVKRSDLTYKVNYLEKTTNKVLHEAKTARNQVFDSSITAESEKIAINGYEYNSADKLELTITTGENVLNLYYTKRADLSYTVNYLEEGTEKVLSPAKTVNNVKFETVITSSKEAINIDGYNYAYPDNETLTVGTGENVINIYYTKVDNLSYRINFLEKDTNKQLHAPDIQGNQEFEAVITAADKVIDINGYNYDSVDKETITIGTSENVINVYYTKRNDLTYKVNYLEKTTNKEIASPKIAQNQIFETEIHAADEVITIDGYSYDSVSVETLVVGTNESANVITIYYTKRANLTYRVNYLEKDTNEVLQEAKIGRNVAFESTIKATDEKIDIDGYNFDSFDKEMLKITTGENVINIYYTKKNDLSYTVNYLEKTTNKVLNTAKVVNNVTFKDKIDSIKQAITIDGYNYDSVNKETLVVGTSENVINVYYVKRRDLSYKVNYLEKNSDRVLHEQKTVSGQTFEATIRAEKEKINIDGFDFDSVDNETITITTGENIINIYYTKRANLSYKVNYLEKDTNRVLNTQKVQTNVAFETVVKAVDEKIEIDGFVYDSSDKETILIGTSENVINLYYIKRVDLSYKVNYLEKDTNKVLHEQKVQNGVTFESVITSINERIDIDGYDYNSADKESLSILTGENIINLYYTKKTDLSYKVNYLEKGTNRVLNTQKVQNGVTFEAVVKAADEVITIDGFNYDSVDKDTISITTGENVINIYYIKRTDLSYKVNYLEKDTNKVLNTQKVQNGVTFEAKIKTSDEVIDIDGYDYSSIDKSELLITTDENVINIYYTKRTNLSYTVNYLEKGTNKVLSTQKVQSGMTFETRIKSADEAIEINGFNYDFCDKDELVITTGENVINLYYTKVEGLSYKINYLEKGTNKQLLSPKVQGNQVFENVIKAADEVVLINGYNYDSCDKDTLSIGTSENVINLYYTKRIDLVYKVNYLEKDSDKEIATQKVVENQVFGSEINAIDEVITINGYNYDSISIETLTIGTDENIINVYYTKRANLTYKVNYLELDTNEILHDQKIVRNVKFDDVIKAQDEVIEIDGYDYDSRDKEMLKITTGENVINIYYTKRTDLNYKVNYLERGTNRVLATAKVVNDVTFSDVITASKEVISIDGFRFDSVDKDTLTIATGENVINIYYAKRVDLSYIVNYVEKDTGRVLHEQKIANNVRFEDTITARNEVISIDGFDYNSVDKETLSITTGENVINIYYTKRTNLSYKVNYLEKDTNRVLSSTKTVNGVTFEAVIKSRSEVIDIDGFNYDSVDKDELTITTGENVINIYYTKRVDLTYKVNYLEKDTDRVLHDQKVASGVIFEAVIRAEDEVIDIDGFNYNLSDRAELEILTGENILNLYYTKRADLTYKVNYLEKDTNRVLNDQKVVNNVRFEDVIKAADEVIDIDGFNYDSVDKDTISITISENVVNIYYTKRTDLSYKVNYLEKDTNRILNDQKVVNNVRFEDVIKVEDEVIDIDGFDYDSVDKDTISITTDENVINIYYTKRTDLSYKVNYLEKDTDRVLSAQKTVDNKTFEEVITSTSEVIDIDGFDYDSVNPEKLEITTSENIINIYYTKRSNLSYVVNYLEKDTGRILSTQKVVPNVTFEDEIDSTEEIITINGFKFDSVDKDTISITTGENVINIYYTKVEGLSYTVKYEEKDTGRVLHAPKTEGNQTFENEIIAKDEIIDIDGFKFDSVDKEKLSIGTDINEITIYYCKRADLTYKVHYVDGDTGEEIIPTLDVPDNTFEDKIDGKDDVKDIDGYVSQGPEGEIEIGTGDNDVIIIYKKRTDLSYKVNYLEKGTKEEIHESKVVENKTFKDVVKSETEVIDIYGYNYDSVDPEEITITTGENVINIYYTKKDTKVTVHYYEEGTTNKVSGDVTITNKVFAEYETEAADDVPSKYELIAVPENAKGTMTEEEIVVTYYYRKKDTQVIVHYYEEGTNNKLSENVVIDGQVDDKYETKVATDIPIKYELVGTPENAKGNMTEETIEVTYFYRVKDTRLNIRYLEKDTNEVLANPEVQEGKVEEDYITGAKTIEGYTLVGDSGNTTGKLTADPITVTFYYLQNTSVTVNHIDKNTDKELDSYTVNGLVGDKYTSNSKNFDNYILVERPKVETVTMGKAEIIMNYYYVHVSAGVIEKHIDVISGEILNNAAHVGNEGDEYEIPAKEFKGYDLVEDKLPTNAKGTMTIEAQEVIYYYQHKSKVTAEYIDRETGKKLTEDEVQTGHETDAYTTERKEFENYVLVTIPENADGKMTKEEIVATYYYAHTSKGAKVEIIDNATGEIIKEIIIPGNEGDKYEVEPEPIPGYDVVKDKLPENSTGKLPIEGTTIKYYYVKQSSVIIKHIDKVTGKELLESETITGHQGDKYTSKEKEIEGYELLEVPENKEGTMDAEPKEVVYVYTRPAKVVVSYIDIDTNKSIAEDEVIEGHENDEYEVNAKDIKYYKLIENKLPSNSKGTMKVDPENTIYVNYYYRKLTFSMKVDKTIQDATVNGNTLPINGDLGKVEIYRKDIANARVQIRYKIKVTNDGELAGKIKLLEKYPEGTTMSKANNPAWDISNATATMETDEIKPGETREYIVILDWISSEANIGTKPNTVEVLSSENEAGFDSKDINIDIKSDSAELIITVSTGNETYIVGTSIALVVLAGISIVLIRKSKKEN